MRAKAVGLILGLGLGAGFVSGRGAQADPCAAAAAALAERLKAQFQNVETDLSVRMSEKTIARRYETAGECSLATGGDWHAFWLKRRTSESTADGKSSTYTDSRRVVLAPPNRMLTLEYNPLPNRPTPESINHVVSQEAPDPYYVINTATRRAGLDWLTGFGWTGLSVFDFIAADPKVRPTNVQCLEAAHRITYRSICGLVEIEYQGVGNSRSATGVRLTQARDDVLTVDKVPATKGVKLGEAGLGPGLDKATNGIDGFVVEVRFHYRDAAIESLTLNESCRSADGDATRVAELSVVARRPMSAKDLEGKYFATIPAGTQAFIPADKLQRKWENGQAVVDVDAESLIAAERSAFGNAPEYRTHLIVTLLVLIAAATGLFWRRRARTAV